MVAIYTGEIDEEKINVMSYPFFNALLKQLNRRLRYEAAVGYAGNSFFSDSNKLIAESNPMIDDTKPEISYGEQLTHLFHRGMLQVEDLRGTGRKDEFAEEFGLKFGG